MGLQCQLIQQTKKDENTGYDGSKHWKVIHDEMEKIECDYCKQKGIKFARGWHDAVSVNLNKDPKYPNDLRFAHEYLTEARMKIDHVECKVCKH